MKIKNVGNMPVIKEATCDYKRCRATVVDLYPCDVKLECVGMTSQIVWQCPCCGRKNVIPRMTIPSDFMEEVMTLKKEG